MTGQTFETRADWLAARRKNIGGSEVAALFGVQAAYQMSHYTLWQVKAGKIPEPDVSGERPEWGLRLEAAIADGAAERHGWGIEKGGYVEHATIEGMACTLDFVITGYKLDHHEGLDFPQKEARWGKAPVDLEVKNVDWLIHRRQWGTEPPIHIQIQLQHQLACTGHQSGVIQSLIGGNELSEPYAFERRPKIIAEIERRVAAFWQSVRENNPPPVDGSESTADALAAMFPEAVPDKEIEFGTSNQFPGLWATLKQTRLDKKAAEAGERATKSMIMSLAGDAEIIKYNGEIVGTLKTQTRKSYVVKESSSRVLRLRED